MNANKAFGRWGEKLACDYLLKKGFKIRDKNWTDRWAEIDIVATQGTKVHFVEVKARHVLNETMHKSKVAKLLRSCQIYLKKNGLSFDHYQIDFIGIEKGATQTHLEHIENVVEDTY